MWLIDGIWGGKGAVFLTDSECLAREYRDAFGKQVPVLPIPLTDDFGADETPGEMRAGGATQGRSRPPISVIYLGGARDEKGYQLLPEAINYAAQRLGNDTLQYVIHSRLTKSGAEQSAIAKAALARFGSNVVQIDEIMDAGSYCRLLKNADIVVLPYLTEHYKARTSGIFAEAVAAGKPVVVPKGTWMEQQMVKFGVPGALFDGRTAVSLGQAIEQVVQDLSGAQAQGQRASRSWRETHSVGRFVDALMRLAG